MPPRGCATVRGPDPDRRKGRRCPQNAANRPFPGNRPPPSASRPKSAPPPASASTPARPKPIPRRGIRCPRSSRHRCNCAPTAASTAMPGTSPARTRDEQWQLILRIGCHPEAASRGKRVPKRIACHPEAHHSEGSAVRLWPREETGGCSARLERSKAAPVAASAFRPVTERSVSASSLRGDSNIEELPCLAGIKLLQPSVRLEDLGSPPLPRVAHSEKVPGLAALGAQRRRHFQTQQ